MEVVSRKFNCLICSSLTSAEHFKVDKFDELFLLRILLEIPQENPLFEKIKASINFIQICDPCCSTIKQCKEIYGNICEQIETFWELQNKVLEKITSVKRTASQNEKDLEKDSYIIWVDHCRKFVKERKLNIFKENII